MALNSVSTPMLWLVTWPYFWTLCHHTINPIRRISSCDADTGRLRRAVELFRRHKDEELRFVMTASTLSAAANLASLQWPTTPDSPWAARALWFCSLLLSIFALILAAQQSVLLKFIIPPGNNCGDGAHTGNQKKSTTAQSSVANKNEAEALANTLRLFLRRRRQVTASDALNTTQHTRAASNTTTVTIVDDNSSSRINTFEKATIVESQPTLVTSGSTIPSITSRATTSGTLVNSSQNGPDSPHPLHSGMPDLNMIYIWQAPLMLMSWSWVSYILGLTLLVASPALWPQIQYEDDKQVAVFFTACCAISCVNFGWCSLWAYRAAAPAQSHSLDDDAYLQGELVQGQ